jgi:hypothetical protein
MGYSKLEITNGTITVDLLKAEGETGFHLQSWLPNIAVSKGGGVWRDPPLADGRRIVFRRWSTTIETFNIAVNGFDQDTVIRETQDLRRLLEQAVEYWKPGFMQGPVWITAQSDCETNPRYAVIHDWRTPNDDDPYGSNFSYSLALMAGLQLVLERGHWQNVIPENSICAPLDGTIAAYYYGADAVLNGGFETAGGGGADVFANWVETVGTGTIVRSLAAPIFGVASAVLTAGAGFNTLIQQDIVVVPGQLYAFTIYWTTDFRPRFEVRDNTNAVDLVTQVDPPSSKYQALITIPAGCISLGIILRCPASSGKFAKYDGVSLLPLTSTTFGQDNICSELGSFIVHKGQTSQLTHIFRYDQSTGIYSANLLPAALPYDLFPNPLAAGDYLYMGVSDASLGAGPFSNVIFDLNQAAVGEITGSWAIWTGAAWTGISDVDTTDHTSLDSAGLYSDTKPVRNTGITYVNFNPTGWQLTTVNGIYGWWLRLDVTAVAAGAPRPQQQNRAIYTASQPGIFLPGEFVGGDIQALVKDIISGNTYVLGTDKIEDFIVATRSVSRGPLFTPYLNFTDFPANPLITTINASHGVWVSDGFAPTGRFFQITMTSFLGGAGIRLATPLPAQYRGTFRLFVRLKQIAGSANDIKFTTSIQSSTTVTYPQITIPGTGALEILEIGRVVLPQLDLGRNIIPQYLTIQLSFTSTLATGIFNLYDLFLVPVDEWVAQYSTYVNSGLTMGKVLILSSVDPISSVRHTQVDSTDNTQGEWIQQPNLIYSKQFVFNPNEDQALYLFSLRDGKPHTLTSHRIELAQRYFSMRGDR